MGAGPVPPGLLVTPAQLPRYNVPSAFLAQFTPRPIQLLVSTGGQLGAMAFQWQFVGDIVYSLPIASSVFTPWLATIDEAFCDLAFAPGAYVINTTYLVDAMGNVSPGVGAFAGLTASLYDRRQFACSWVTTEALLRMADAIRAPLMTWGDDVSGHAAQWVYAILKRGVGLTPEDAGAGDANIFSSEKMAMEFFDNIGKKGRPASMTDSSPTDDGPLIPVMPKSDPPRGW